MKCPMTMNGQSYAYDCEKDRCAWWCTWNECCSITAIANEISKLSFEEEINKELARRFGKKVD